MSSLWTGKSRTEKSVSNVNGFSTQSVGSFSEYLRKLKVVAEYVKKTTIGELDQLPNRLIHTYYYLNYKQMLYDEKHPEEAKNRATAEILSGGL